MKFAKGVLVVLTTAWLTVPASDARSADVLKALSAATKAVKPSNLSFALTTTSVPFLFANCDYETCKCDICLHVMSRGYFAPVETKIFHLLLGKHTCSTSGGIVVDVGANAGYFTSLAAAYGCNVLALEPNPIASTLARLTAYINGLASKVQLLPYALGASAAKGALVKTESWGLNHVQEASGDSNVEIKPLSDIVQDDVILLKIDTEGYEASVFEGSWAMFETLEVHNIVVEVKLARSPEKRALLKKLMEVGKLPYLYAYVEQYSYTGLLEDMSINNHFHDVSSIIKHEHELELEIEDFWFRREPLPHHLVYKPEGT